MAVDNVVRKCLYMTVEDDTFICERLVRTVGRSMGFLYVKDGFIGSLDPEWIQRALNILIGLFYRIGVMVNVAKFKMITCQPGTIQLGMSEESIGRRSMVRGDTYQEKIMRRIP